MLSPTRREKLLGKVELKGQQKYDFIYDMRMKLENDFHDLKDMTLLMKTLPDDKLKKIDLINFLPSVIEFIDVFLEKANPLPVGEHKSGEIRVFHNIATRVTDRPDLEQLEKLGFVATAEGGKYIIDSDHWKASPYDIHIWEVLKNHSERLRRYIDPRIAVAGKQPMPIEEMHEIRIEQSKLLGKIGMGSTFVKLEKGLPTNPPLQPCILVDATK
jgi:beta-galactosidase beta subunit